MCSRVKGTKNGHPTSAESSGQLSLPRSHSHQEILDPMILQARNFARQVRQCGRCQAPNSGTYLVAAKCGERLHTPVPYLQLDRLT